MATDKVPPPHPTDAEAKIRFNSVFPPAPQAVTPLYRPGLTAQVTALAAKASQYLAGDGSDRPTMSEGVVLHHRACLHPNPALLHRVRRRMDFKGRQLGLVGLAKKAKPILTELKQTEPPPYYHGREVTLYKAVLHYCETQALRGRFVLRHKGRSPKRGNPLH